MSTSQQTDPLIGRLIDGRYRVRARIARGGMATVYVATDLRLERRVALKVMHSHLSDDTVFQSRFIQEARSAARLADPHVVNVFDQGQDGDIAYLVMEYLPGITLRELLREQRRLTVAQAVSIMDAVLSGLAAAHKAGIVHRDVKPENVLLAEDGRIKIGDFGLARATTANTATGSQLLGTIAYLAPELVTRGMADARSDIYSLGIMLYEMLTGEQPYKGEQPMQIAFQHATDSVPRPSVKNPGVPEQLDELVLWSTERNPDDRPLDASEMLDRLREIEHDLGISPIVTRAAAVNFTVDDANTSGDLTAVMPASTTMATATVDTTDNATRLQRASKRRRAKGGWLVFLVLLLAAAAGGTGWWFGTGPGSQVQVASVEGLTFEQAQQRLAEDTLVAVQQDQSSLDIEPGTVIGTDPDPGTRLDQDSEVSVIISTGPAPVTVTKLIGQSEDDARATLDALIISVDEQTSDFYTDSPDGTVVGTTLSPADGSDAIECGDGCDAHEGDSAKLWVSLGALPNVAGASADSARSTLTDAGLEVGGNIEQSSDSVAAGNVIGITERSGGGWWRPSDQVSLIVSTGPPLFAIPSVVGMTRDEAISTLEGQGFQVDYGFYWDAFPNDITSVTSSDPAAGEMRVAGTRVEVEMTARG
ncbi:Stk1 family PASTA domain-containing Ser/Thr kinase (plasmid) [Coraliomargarita sp. W4R53]